MGEPDAEPNPGSAEDLEPADVLREQHYREGDGDEGLQVREQRGTGRADAVDRLEPEDVGQDEGTEHRVDE